MSKLNVMIVIYQFISLMHKFYYNFNYVYCFLHFHMNCLQSTTKPNICLDGASVMMQCLTYNFDRCLLKYIL